MQISSSKSDNIITLSIEGRIDTNTSPQLQAELLSSFQRVSNVRLDLGNIEYISSAGLRALLIGQKTAMSKGGRMELYNVPEAVMTVLNMTGFSSMLNIV